LRKRGAARGTAKRRHAEPRGRRPVVRAVLLFFLCASPILLTLSLLSLCTLPYLLRPGLSRDRLGRRVLGDGGDGREAGLCVCVCMKEGGVGGRGV
jgi:hypothetical protein